MKIKKPRIAFLLQMFGVGGMPKWLFHIAENLKESFDFYFVSTHTDYFPKEYAEAATLKNLPLNKWVIAGWLKLNKIDIVQVANLRLYTDAALLAGVPVIVERTDGIRNGAAFSPKDGLDAVIASTQGIIPHLEKMIAPDKIYLIYNGVDIQRFGNVRPERFDFAPDDIIIGRTSRLAGGKNISLLIQAVLQIHEDLRYEHVKLVICGGDTTQTGAKPMLEILKKEAEPLGNNVKFTGEVFDPYPIICGYDIATCTSLPENEGIPNSLIEPMAAGKPVVSTEVGDIPELVEDGVSGFLIPTDDLRALVEALLKLVDDAELRFRMGAAGKNKISQQFNLDTQVQKYKELYSNLLLSKSGILFE